MKKINLFIILLLVSIPMFVNADGGAPMIKPYKVRISNNLGATIYKYESKKYIQTDEKLKYDEQYILTHEMIHEGELYGVVYKEKDGEISYNIKLSDVKPLEINLNDYKQDLAKNYYVFGNNTKLYKGPSKIYGQFNPEIIIKDGSSFKTQYYDEAWAYIEYEGVKGWIYTYTLKEFSPYEESADVTELEHNKIISLKTLDEVKIYKNPKTKEVLSTIGANTELSNLKLLSIYHFERNQGANYYIEYNGEKGWIVLGKSHSNIAHLVDNKELLFVANKNGIELYSSPNDDANIISNISYQEELIPTYYYYEDYSEMFSEYWYQVSYDGKNGWIKLGNEYDEVPFLDIARIANDEEIKIENRQGITLYKFINDDTSEIETIPYTTRIKPTLYIYTNAGTWYFIEYSNQKGWIFIEDEISEDNNNDNEEGPIAPNKGTSSSSKNNYHKVPKLTIKEKILNYTCIVIVTTLTAVVTMMLINEKKKERNNIKKQENINKTKQKKDKNATK